MRKFMTVNPNDYDSVWKCMKAHEVYPKVYPKMYVSGSEGL